MAAIGATNDVANFFRQALNNATIIPNLFEQNQQVVLLALQQYGCQNEGILPFIALSVAGGTQTLPKDLRGLGLLVGGIALALGFLELWTLLQGMDLTQAAECEAAAWCASYGCPPEQTIAYSRACADKENVSAKVWRAISLAGNRIQFNWRPTSIDWDGLSGTRGGTEPYWVDPEIWFGTSFSRIPEPATDRVMAANEIELINAGFSVENTPREEDSWHVSIGGTNPGIVDRNGQPSWPGNRTTRREYESSLESLFNTQVWP